RDHRREDVRQLDRARRVEGLLADELDQVGDRLEEAERAGAVRPVAELHPSEGLALEPGRVRERDHHEVDDEERLGQRDPPRLGRVAHLRTSTIACSSPASGLATRTVPAATSCAIRARSATLVPFELTVTVSPAAIPRARASARASSTSPRA